MLQVIDFNCFDPQLFVTHSASSGHKWHLWNLHEKWCACESKAMVSDFDSRRQCACGGPSFALIFLH